MGAALTNGTETIASPVHVSGSIEELDRSLDEQAIPINIGAPL